MARLTRTQKYADLRDSFNNDAEQSTTTDRLAGYESRLNNITETLTPNIDSINTQPSFENNANLQNQYSASNFNNNINTQNTYSTPINSSENINVIDDIDAFLHSDNNTPKYVYPNVTNENSEYLSGQDLNAYEKAPVTSTFNTPEQKQEEITSIDDYFKVVSDQLSTLTTEVPEFESSGNMETYTSDLPVITDDFIKSVEQEININPQYTNTQAPVYNTVNTTVAPSTVTYDIPAQPTIEPVVNNNSFLTAAIDEANAYNQMNGQKTIDDVANSMINDVRHNPQEVMLDADEIAPVQTMNRQVNNDDNFSETVSLEISKIMDEVAKPIDNTPSQSETEFERTLTAERPDEEVVEIKNINELKADPVRENTISETIPFVVSDNDELLDEDYDEEESNTILNIILIVLIVILVAVLGLIIFYILKTKNIL